MLKSHWKLISRIERIGDNIIIIGAFFFAYAFRDVIFLGLTAGGFPTSEQYRLLLPIQDYLIILGIGLPLYNAALSIVGAYNSMRLLSIVKLLRMCFVSSIVVFVGVGFVLYLLKLDLSRSFLSSFCILSGVGHFVERFFMLRFLRYWRVRGRNYRNLLIVGTGEQARKVYLELLQEEELGIRVIGFIDLEAKHDVQLHVVGSNSEASSSTRITSQVYDLPARVIANAETFEAALKKHAVDEVLFTDVISRFSVVKELAQIAAEEGKRVTLAADLFSMGLLKSDTSFLGSVPLIHYQTAPSDNSGLFIKRLLDISISALAIVGLSPLMLIVAAAIKLDSPGPVLFTQKRMGLNGRSFKLLKFRSMVRDAETMLDSLKEHNEMTGPVFKMKNDPRITPLGKFLRKTSIDELPQFINVVLGDMSLVGPRPPLPEEVSLYDRKHRRRLSMRPGITCTWQVSGRNDILDFEQWAKLDLEYIDNWSLKSDIVLLLRTIPVVMLGVGAR